MDWSLPRRAIVVLAASIIVLLFLDLLLFSLGSAWGGGLPVAVWGTYAAWAAALTPPIALAVTAVTWMTDRRQRESERLDQELFRVRVEPRADGVWLVNDSTFAILGDLLETTAGLQPFERWMLPGSSEYAGLERDFVRVRIYVLRTPCWVEANKMGTRA